MQAKVSALFVPLASLRRLQKVSAAWIVEMGFTKVKKVRRCA
jgi:hypothetical protein